MLFYGLVLLWQGMPSAQLTDGGDMFDICGHTSTRYPDPWRISIGMTGYRQCKICNKPQNITGIVCKPAHMCLICTEYLQSMDTLTLGAAAPSMPRKPLATRSATGTTLCHVTKWTRLWRKSWRVYAFRSVQDLRASFAHPAMPTIMYIHAFG